jgi:hypothetical protein
MDTRVKSTMAVDVSRGENIPISFDIAFSRLPCPLINIDARDLLGERLSASDIAHKISKMPLDKNGKPKGSSQTANFGTPLSPTENTQFQTPEARAKLLDPSYCGSCYGAEVAPGDCCNTCDMVRAAYKTKGWVLKDLSTIEQCLLGGETVESFRNMLEQKEGCRVTGTQLRTSNYAHFFFRYPERFEAGWQLAFLSFSRLYSGSQYG